MPANENWDTLLCWCVSLHQSTQFLGLPASIAKCIDTNQTIHCMYLFALCCAGGVRDPGPGAAAAVGAGGRGDPGAGPAQRAGQLEAGGGGGGGGGQGAGGGAETQPHPGSPVHNTQHHSQGKPGTWLFNMQGTVQFPISPQ